MTTATTQRARSFGELFAQRVAKTPDKEAYRYLENGQWRSLTWAETKDRVYRIAAGLIDLGVQPQQRVALASTTRIEWVLADLAILCAGAATTSVYPTTGPEDFNFILNDSGSVLLFAENAEQAAKATESAPPQLRTVVLFDGKAGTAAASTAADASTAGGADAAAAGGNAASDSAAAGDGSGASVGTPGQTGDRATPDVTRLTLDELAGRGATRLATKPDLVDRRLDGIDPEHLATLMYTSGTTGRPKGVRLVHANWLYEGRAVAALNILTPEDVQYLWLPLSHVLGKVLSAVQLELGFSTAVNGDLTRIVENLGAIKPTFMGGAPRIFEKVRAKVTLTARSEGGLKARIFDWAIGAGIKGSRIRQERKSPSLWLSAQLAVADRLVFHKIRARLGGNIRFFVSGSAALSRDVAEWFDAVGLIILEGYGLTESSAAAAVNLPDDVRIGTVGPALPGTELRIADDGEILIRGGGVMRGYHNKPEATAEVLTEDGWLHTGDIGELVDGYLRVTDRKKDLIKTSGGKYIAPQKLEVLFKAGFPYASQIVVHGEGRKFASALITLDPELIEQWAELHELSGRSAAQLAKEPTVMALVQEHVDQLNAQLERWETVKRFIVLEQDLSVEEGDLTPSMKVRRRVVERKHRAQLDELYTES